MRDIDIASQIVDYKRLIKSEGSHSKLGKFYRRVVGDLERFYTSLSQFRSDASFDPKALTEQAWADELEALSYTHEALNGGATMHIFRSGGGLRVVNVGQEGKEIGYGESPYIEDALVLADRDIHSGRKDYHDVYGKDYPHFYTGSSEPSSDLDQWILRGNTIDAWHDGAHVVTSLNGWEHTEFPEDLRVQVETTGEPATWSTDRGYTYQMDRHVFANGDIGVSGSIISPVDEEKAHRAWMYPIVKTGYGSSFHEAIASAFIAPSVEVFKP